MAAPRRALLLATLVLLPALAGNALGGASDLRLRDPVVVRAAAVAQTDHGLTGSLATVSITLADNGTGHVFLDTIPLTQVDMQGSARLAVQVAGAVTGVDTRKHDFFFVVRSGSQIIGGPSAGAIMTVGVIAALKGWEVDERVMMTGTVNPDGSVGPVGGVPEKAAAAARAGAVRFLYPEGQDAIPGGGTMPQYCERRLGIRCEPVSDVEQAVLAVTGHAFERPPVVGNATDENFRRVLAPFSDDLVQNATALLAEARDAFQRARDGMPARVATTLEASLKAGDDSLASARAALEDENYYAAASKSFMASIQGRSVRDVAGFYLAQDPSKHLAQTLAAMDAEVRAAAEQTRAAEATSMTMLQAVGAAQSRATEAEDLAAKAHAAAEGANPEDVLAAYDAAAYALERARTAPWWLRIGAAFEAGAPAAAVREPADVEQAARENIENAQQAITYVEVILEEVGLGEEATREPARLLAAARRDAAQGFHAAALFQAIEAEVRANLLLELVHTGAEFPASRVDVARERAQRAIVESRELGVEPLLAMSYYEFAATLDAPVEAVTFFNLARTVGKLAKFLTQGPEEPTPSRFVGNAEVTWWSYRIPASWASGFFALGLALGLGGGAAAFYEGRSRNKETRTLRPHEAHQAPEAEEAPRALELEPPRG